MTTACDAGITSPEPKRNFSSEMTAVIEKYTPVGDYIAAEVATKIIDDLSAEDPALLDGWLRDSATALLTHHIGQRRRAHLRAATVRRTVGLVFGEAAEQYSASVAAGAPDASVFSVFEERLIVNGNYTARKIGQMRREDHLFVARQFGRRAERSMKLRLFHEMVAAKMPDDTVTTGEAFTEEEYLTIYRQVFGG